jgi:hypothetical protein
MRVGVQARLDLHDNRRHDLLARLQSGVIEDGLLQLDV